MGGLPVISTRISYFPPQSIASLLSLCYTGFNSNEVSLPYRAQKQKEASVIKLPLKKIVTYGCLILIGLIIIFLVCLALLHLDSVGGAIGGVLAALRAIFLGFAMAYLLYPLARFSENFFLRHKVRAKNARSLSVAFSTAVVLALLFLFGYFVIPQLVFNVPALVQNLPDMMREFADNLSAFLVSHGQSTEILDQLTDKITTSFNGWLKNDLLSTLSSVFAHVVTAAKGVLNFIIGIIVMVYLLISRDQFIGQGKKMLYALCKNRTNCAVILKHLRKINQIFSGFVSGKLLDSLIIGIICGVCLSILRIPYPLLISVIVGCTNIIPVFGPFFGAIPSAFLLLLTGPSNCLIFLIFIFILQQVDGNIIGPKILGDSTGLSAFWVLFSLLLFNHLMGFWGMLLGVPLFASFYYLAGEFFRARLRKRNLPVSTAEYVNISSIENDGRIVYLEKNIEAPHPLRKRKARLLLRKLHQQQSAPPPDDAPEPPPKDPTER